MLCVPVQSSASVLARFLITVSEACGIHLLSPVHFRLTGVTGFNHHPSSLLASLHIIHKI